MDGSRTMYYLVRRSSAITTAMNLKNVYVTVPGFDKGSATEVEIVISTISKFIIRHFITQTDASQVTFTMIGTNALQLPVYIISDSLSSQIPCQRHMIPFTGLQLFGLARFGKFTKSCLYLQLLAREVRRRML